MIDPYAVAPRAQAEPWEHGRRNRDEQRVRHRDCDSRPEPRPARRVSREEGFEPAGLLLLTHVGEMAARTEGDECRDHEDERRTEIARRGADVPAERAAEAVREVALAYGPRRARSRQAHHEPRGRGTRGPTDDAAAHEPERVDERIPEAQAT